MLKNVKKRYHILKTSRNRLNNEQRIKLRCSLKSGYYTHQILQINRA